MKFRFSLGSLIFFLALSVSGGVQESTQGSGTRGVFSFHLKNEPATTDPTLITSGESTYLFNTLFRGLLRYSDEHDLSFDMAEKCTYKTPTLIHCRIQKDVKWSDGKPVTADDFVNSFRRIVSPDSKCP